MTDAPLPRHSSNRLPHRLEAVLEPRQDLVLAAARVVHLLGQDDLPDVSALGLGTVDDLGDALEHPPDSSHAMDRGALIWVVPQSWPWTTTSGRVYSMYLLCVYHESTRR
jgi:hypothetical protein